jgi:hypothetical protein
MGSLIGSGASSRRPSSGAATPSPSAAAAGAGGGALTGGALYNLQRRLSPATIAAGHGRVAAAQPEGVLRPGGTAGMQGVLPNGLHGGHGVLAAGLHGGQDVLTGVPLGQGVPPTGLPPVAGGGVAAAIGSRRASSSASMVAQGDGGGVGFGVGVGGVGQGESAATAAAKSKALAAGAAAALEKQEQLRKVASYYKEQYEVSWETGAEGKCALASFRQMVGAVHEPVAHHFAGLGCLR